MERLIDRHSSVVARNGEMVLGYSVDGSAVVLKSVVESDVAVVECSLMGSAADW